MLGRLRIVVVLVLLMSGASLVGACGRQERTISVTSEPAGALVWVNDVQIGRTPCETDFTFFGTYDVRLSLEGYEPIATSAEADAPFYEQPFVDLVAAAVPGTRRTRIEWHYVLTPLPEVAGAEGDRDAAEAALVQRARALRDRGASGGASGAGAGEARKTDGAPAPMPQR